MVGSLGKGKYTDLPHYFKLILINFCYLYVTARLTETMLFNYLFITGF